MTTPETQKENRAAWVVALRSDNFKQCSERLHDGSGYCCLGVGAVVCGFKPIKSDLHPDRFDVDGSVSILNTSAELLGIDAVGSYTKDGQFRSLALDNDKHGMTFSEIADIIESEPEGLVIG